MDKDLKVLLDGIRDESGHRFFEIIQLSSYLREQKYITYEQSQNYVDSAFKILIEAHMMKEQHLTEVSVVVNSGDNRSVNTGGGSITGSVITTGDGNTVRLRDINVSMPDSGDVDIRKEVQELRVALEALNAPEAGKLGRALADADDELKKENPEKSEVGNALERAVKYAKDASEFGDQIEKLAPRLVAISAWLGAYGSKLLSMAGITL